MRLPIPFLLIGLTITACSASAPPLQTVPKVGGGQPLASAMPATASALSPTAPGQSVKPSAISTQQPVPGLTLQGAFPVGALARVRSKFILLQLAAVTLDDLSGLGVSLDGITLEPGRFTFSDVTLVDGQVHFTLQVPTAPADSQTLEVANTPRTFSLMTRIQRGNSTLDSESTAIALLRIEQARRGEPTDGPLPASLIARLAQLIDTTLSTFGTSPLDDALARAVGLATDMATQDDLAEFNRELGQSHTSGGGGGSVIAVVQPPLPLSVETLSFGSPGSTKPFTVDTSDASPITAHSDQLDVATVAPASDDPKTFNVTSVAAGTATITLKAQDGRSATLHIVVTTTTLTIQ